MIQILENTHKDNNYRQYVRCLCFCGTEFIVRASNIKNGHTTSCGCRKREIASRRGKLNKPALLIANTTHGDASQQRGRPPEYDAWATMKYRCNTETAPMWPDYGGRGIKVCDRWQSSYEVFLSDMGRKPKSNYSLDRINNDGNYEPSNCRWATAKEQANNRRKTNGS